MVARVAGHCTRNVAEKIHLAALPRRRANGGVQAPGERMDTLAQIREEHAAVDHGLESAGEQGIGVTGTDGDGGVDETVRGIGGQERVTAPDPAPFGFGPVCAGPRKPGWCRGSRRGRARSPC